MRELKLGSWVWIKSLKRFGRWRCGMSWFPDADGDPIEVYWITIFDDELVRSVATPRDDIELIALH